jgi:predicted outer membrane lipoprotein
MSLVSFLLAVWVFGLLIAMSAAVITAYLLPPEDAERDR